MKWVQLCGSLNNFWHCLSLRLEWKLTFFQCCGHYWVFQVCWHIECSTLTASYFRIWIIEVELQYLNFCRDTIQPITGVTFIILAGILFKKYFLDFLLKSYKFTVWTHSQNSGKRTSPVPTQLLCAPLSDLPRITSTLTPNIIPLLSCFIFNF